ncbi:MAG: ABC transporter permease subunit [Kineosporiaceae bacterium]
MTTQLLDGSAPGTATGDRRESFVAGVLTVARLELRQRVRSTRWIVVLAVWTVLLLLLTALIRWSVSASYDLSPANEAAQAARIEAGRTVFGIVVFLVLSLGALVTPALSSTSINGDRSAGVLAMMQTTLLTPTQIVVGKLAAAWSVALALLVCALPDILWAYLQGGTPLGRLLVIVALLAVVLLVICAIGLGWSAIAARTSSSALLTYLSVALLGLGLPLLFALSVPLVSTTEKVTVRQLNYDENGGSTATCVTTTETQSVFHSERSWWLLAPSPYVILADAAPRPKDPNTSSDPLSTIRTGVREARLGPEDVLDWCGPGAPGVDALPSFEARQAQRDKDRERLGVTWPYGLAVNLLLGGGFTALAIRRLRTPARTLPRGTRVA